MTHANPSVQAAPRWQAVCRRQDLVANSGVVVWHDGAQVALFYLPADAEGRVLHAIAHHDPQSGANVLGRGIVGSLQGQLVVASPLYKQHYCLLNGQCLEQPDQRIDVWPVRLVGDEVQLGALP